MGDLKVKLTDEEIRELRDAAEAVDLSAGWHGEEGLYTDIPKLPREKYLCGVYFRSYYCASYISDSKTTSSLLRTAI